jgi:ABC-2 type transport system ATP-binding protein
MKQKLAVARALLHRPAVLFLDEPTAGLDAIAATALREDLSTLAAKEGVTVFLTTHNLGEAEKLCGTVAVIDKGRLLKVGTPEEFRRAGATTRLVVVGRGLTDELRATLLLRPEVASVERSDGAMVIEVRGGADTAPLVGAIAASGAQIDEVRKGKASLEEAFLELVETT